MAKQKLECLTKFVAVADKGFRLYSGKQAELAEHSRLETIYSLSRYGQTADQIRANTEKHVIENSKDFYINNFHRTSLALYIIDEILVHSV